MGNKSQRSRLPAHPLPTADFQQRVLPITECQTTWYRLNPSNYDSALYFDRSDMGRYDGSSQSYGILYVAEALEGAFIESFGRSHGAKGVAEADLKNRNLFEIKSDRQLTLVDLWGSGLVKIGADARITSGSDYELSRAWVEAICLHSLKVDGIRYYSRHDNTQLCCGLFDRTSVHLKEQNKGNIVDSNRSFCDNLLDQNPDRLCFNGSGLPNPTDGSPRSISLRILQRFLCNLRSFVLSSSYGCVANNKQDENISERIE